MSYFVSALAMFLTLYWGLITWRSLQGTAATPPLPPLPSNRSSHTMSTDRMANVDVAHSLQLPSVSVIVPARNEAARIRQTVEQLLEQRAVTLQIIVVNDRSTDGTATIVNELHEKYGDRVACVNVEELPEGWLGKCHACWLGEQHATGDWILFVDGDIHMRDDVVARAVLQAEREKADHLTLFPNLIAEHFGPRLAIVGQSVMFLLYTRPEQINRDRGRRAVGIGAFNLLRRSSYEAIGGHKALRMEVVDDMRLGELVRARGLRQRVYFGVDDIQADWAQSIGGVIRALEKNWFAMMDYRLFTASFVLISVALSIILGATGPVWAGTIGWAPWLAWLSVSIPGIRIARQFHWPWYIGLLNTLGWFIFLAAGANSVWKTTRQGGIWWRDRFYSLAELQAIDRSY